MIYDWNAFCEGCKDKATWIVLWFIEAPTEEVKGDWNMQPIQDWITDAFNDYDKHQKSDPNNIRWKRGRFRASIEKNMPNGIAIGKLSEDYMPKPVEQELIPLDELTIDKVRALWIQLLNEETLWLQRDDVPENIIYNFLSKYWVHKQEESNVITNKQLNDIIWEIINIMEWKWLKVNKVLDIEKILASYISTPTPQATSVIDIKKDFEANMLDWDDIDDCWGAMLSAKSVLEYLSSLPIVQKKYHGYDCECEWCEAYKDHL